MTSSPVPEGTTPDPVEPVGPVAVDPVRLGTAPGRWVLLATVLASGMALLGASAVNVALPAIGEDLGAGLAGLQWTLSGYTLALASLILLGGALGDRYGRRRVFLVGVVWFAVTSLGCGLAQSTGQLVAMRVLQGVGATRRLSAVRWGVAGNIVVAWVVTLPAAGLVAAVAFFVTNAIVG